MQIKGQSYRSEFNSSLGYAEDLRALFQSATEMRVRVALGNYELVPALLADLGGAVSILKMATSNMEAREELGLKYKELRDSIRVEMTKVHHGKETFRYSLIDNLEDYQDFLMQQTQNVKLGFSMIRQMGKKEKMMAAVRKA